MKKILKATSLLALVLAYLFCMTACGNAVNKTDLWENATYLQDTTFGEGSKTVVVEVTAEEKTVTFTVKTDEKTVGAALLAHDLIAGDQGAYGLYLKVANGITADYDIDKSYWAFYVDGEYANAGVDSTEIAEGVKYQLVYTK